MADYLIHAVGLARRYQMGKTAVDALRGVDVQVEAGEFVALVGPSGSGKSTLLHLIGGLVRPTAGEIWVNGLELGASSDQQLVVYRRDTLGFVFQSFNLLPIKLAWENVAVPLMLAGMPAAQRKARALEMLTQLGLGQRGHHRPSELSGGEQQRVAIARALANRPRLLLADEPTGNLDSRTGNEIMTLLQRLVREEGLTMLLVTHDMGVAHYADRIVHLRDGAIERMEQVREAPRD
ncbi:ABC transporter ATP-binding protein [Candidatus Viridilinea mediisalina]|uniref:Macrolide ABC transporter ATP-binding protein n=1 Tax=Candidatus Viridilinea mediisalina TaxID=2024553 RepID=A0A2A6RF65_9CHLR|nr:ABC transporter ATP-binding protein [Candidatus Viridilinea mediisalina]PDW01500.1 macrolide ABC transporter ATP-binding protein [Candidatus Viridilinea mediisalina]